MAEDLTGSAGTDPDVSNEIAAIVEGAFGGYVPLSIRYGIAYAVQHAGFVKNADEVAGEKWEIDVRAVRAQAWKLGYDLGYKDARYLGPTERRNPHRG